MAELLAASGDKLRVFKRGEVVEGVVTAVSGRELLVDLGGKMEGVVGDKEWDEVREYALKLKTGDKITVVIISPETERGQLVVSIRQASRRSRWQRARDLLSSGEAIPAKGIEVNKGGLVVSFEGTRGFIPSSQLSAEHQGEINRLVNRVLTVKVIEVDEAQNRLVFSEKAVLGAADLARRLAEVKGKVQIGEKYPGKVTAVMTYGLFVKLAAGPEGLVHISEVSWSKVDDLGAYFKVGDEVETMVLGISETDGKLNLSLKQLLPDPWQNAAKIYALDQEVRGKIARIGDYGIFVALPEGIEGLIHASKVPPEAEYKTGETITCTIESMDVAAHRLSLLPVLTAKPIGYK